MSADKITSGAWSARWGNWAIGLRQRDNAWLVTVWQWAPGTALTERKQIDVRDDFDTPALGVAWACDVLRDNGAKVFVVGRPSMRLDKVLMFNPAPEATP